jgi:2-polyprenyl-6-methoxyphenol hydroxylase-like FAD-dependent oxidoreductase
MTDNDSIMIVGGGVGGITSALALAKLGRKVSVYEQSEEIAPIGYGVQIGPNVLPMLDRLGVGNAARKVALAPDDVRLYEMNSGELLGRIPLKGEGFDAHYQHPYLAIHRVDLHHLLLEACKSEPNISLNQSTTVEGFSQTRHGVTLHAKGGKDLQGVALIAADGLRSRIRSAMFPGDESRDTGYFAHRTIMPMAEAPASLQARTGVTMWTGAGFHVIYYPLRDRSEMNIVVVHKAPVGAEAMDSETYKHHVMQKCAMAQPEVRDAVGIVNLERRWAIADRNPIRQWSLGRVTLLGDAAHATLQSLAQGAGMAIEDSVALAQCVQQHGDDYPTAFSDFAKKRFVRTARVQLESRALWEAYHCDGIDAEIRNQQFKARTPEDFFRCVQWLWSPTDL